MRYQNFLLALAVVACTRAARAGTTYSATDLGALSGGDSLAAAISSDGRVAGFASISNRRILFAEHAFTWTQATGIVDVHDRAYTQSLATGINAAGTVVANADIEDQFGNQTPYAVVSSGAGGFTRLAGAFSSASGINDSGVVVGSFTVGSVQHAFTWTAAGGLEDLGLLGGTSSTGVAIAPNGDVLASITTPRSFGVPVLIRGTRQKRINIPGSFQTTATALNGRDQVVGFYAPVTSPASDLGFYYAASKLSPLPGLPAASAQVTPYGINASGTIVGGASNGDGSVILPLLWASSTATPVDLNTLITSSGIQLRVAYAINDQGQIVGYGSVPGASQFHAILLTPNP